MTDFTRNELDLLLRAVQFADSYEADNDPSYGELDAKINRILDQTDPQNPAVTLLGVQKALRNAGISEGTREQAGNREIRHMGFEAVERDGQIHVSYTLGSWADRMDNPEKYRGILEAALTDMEHVLMRHGYTVTLFVPETGIRFFELTVHAGK